MNAQPQRTEADDHRDFIYELLEDHAKDLERDASRRQDPVHDLTVLAHIEDILVNWDIQLEPRKERS